MDKRKHTNTPTHTHSYCKFFISWEKALCFLYPIIVFLFQQIFFFLLKFYAISSSSSYSFLMFHFICKSIPCPSPNENNLVLASKTFSMNIKFSIRLLSQSSCSLYLLCCVWNGRYLIINKLSSLYYLLPWLSLSFLSSSVKSKSYKQIPIHCLLYCTNIILLNTQLKL